MDEVYENAVKFNALVLVHRFTQLMIHTLCEVEIGSMWTFSGLANVCIGALNTSESNTFRPQYVYGEKKRRSRPNNTSRRTFLHISFFLPPALGLLVCWYVFLVVHSYIMCRCCCAIALTHEPNNFSVRPVNALFIVCVIGTTILTLMWKTRWLFEWCWKNMSLIAEWKRKI